MNKNTEKTTENKFGHFEVIQLYILKMLEIFILKVVAGDEKKTLWRQCV